MFSATSTDIIEENTPHKELKPMKIILYGSHYGTARLYAEELSRRTGITAENYEGIKSLDGYETIVYIGALYAGGVLGMTKTFKKLSICENRNILIATVGLADPSDKENVANIENALKRQLPRRIYERASIYHLRGGIDYAKLNLVHKTMMRPLHKKAENLPEEKKTAEVKAMLATYNKSVSFVDFSAVERIANALQK